MSHVPVESHYTVRELEEVILAALTQMGKDVDALVPADLAPVDEFHIRGREATSELIELVKPQSDWNVLDVGCGLGGTCRYLASEHGCQTTGLDLTEAYCITAALLSRRVGLSDRTTFRHGSALDMPFESATFDAVWTEHTQMNVENKRTFYAEILRVLKRGGRLAFHDIFQGHGGDPYFPVPWADLPSISFLARAGDVRSLLTDLGLEIRHWEDKTQESLAWFRAAVERMKSQGPSPLGLHLLMGADSKLKFEHQISNLEEDRISVAQAVLVKR